MFKRYGEEPADATNETIMTAICETIMLFKAAVEGGLPGITPDSFVAGAESLGTSLPALTGLGRQLFRPGRHSGGMNYRHVAFDAACKCFHYTSRNFSDA